jgi:hypothetical protein
MAYTSQWDPAPWAIDGGANGVKAARMALWASTNGAEGVVGVNDLKVRQLDTPGAGVQVAPGGALVLNRASGGANETYGTRLGVRDTVDIAKTGTSGGRTDLVYNSVEDPFESGTGFQVPDDPDNGQYVFTRVIPNVSDTVTELQQVPGYANATGYAVARVKIPANTATITDAMITDLRRVARPRRDPQQMAKSLVGTGERITATSTQGEAWPNAGVFNADVPTWATRVQIVAIWGSAQAPADGNGTAYGRLWVQVGATNDASVIRSQESSWDTVDVAKGSSRQTMVVGDELAIPAGLRGRTIPVYMMARRANAGAASEALAMDAVSSVVLQLNFLERAE